MKVIVAGAGIGGLSAALSLHAAGIDAIVIDSAAALRPLGVGINLMPHAVRELTELGLGGELEATGIPTAEMVHFDRHGNRIWGFASGRNIGYRWPQYSIHRGELQMILLAAVRDRLGPGAVRTGTAFASFTESPAEVSVRVRDRSSGTISELRGDVLVGADGLYSRVRAQLHPVEPPPRWGGVMMWRGVMEGAPFLTGRTVAVAGTNAALKFVAYPISRQAERRGRALLNWVAEVMLPGRAELASLSRNGADWNREGRLEDVLPWFADWKFGWLDVPALITGAPRILEYPMVDRDPLPSWGSEPSWGAAGHPARRRGPPDVPDRGQRRLPGGGGRPGARLVPGPRAAFIRRPGPGARRLRVAAPPGRQRHRAGLPRHAGRSAAADGEHAGAGRLRADRGRAERGRAGRVRPGLPGDDAARRGRAQLPAVADAVSRPGQPALARARRYQRCVVA